MKHLYLKRYSKPFLTAACLSLLFLAFNNCIELASLQPLDSSSVGFSTEKPVVAYFNESFPDKNLQTGQLFTKRISAVPIATTINCESCPSWLSFSGSTLSGTPTTAGIYNVKVWAKYNSNIASIFKTFKITVTDAPPPPEPASFNVSFPNVSMQKGRNFSKIITATPAGYTLSCEGCPTWLSFSGSNLNGTTSSAGTYNIKVWAKYTDGTADISKTFTLIVTNPPIAQFNMNFPNVSMKTGELFNKRITATPSGYSLSCEGCPSWLSFSGADLKGTPTSAGTHNVKIWAKYTNGVANIFKTFTLTVSPQPIAQFNVNFPNVSMNTGELFNKRITALPTGYTLTCTVCPSWLSIAGADLKGTPTAAGTYTARIDANYTNGIASIFKAFTITVTNPTPIAQFNVNFPNQSLIVNQPFTKSITATPTGYTLSCEGCPNWLSFSGADLKGTPTAAGTHNVKIWAKYTNGVANIFKNFLIVVANDPSLPPLGTNPTSSVSIASISKDSAGDLTIAAGQHVVLDRSIEVRHLKISGNLYCDLETHDAETIIAETVSVMGQFICGSTSLAFPGSLQIKLREGFELMGMGKRGLIAHHNGQIKFFGQKKLVRSKLAQHAEPGALSVTLVNSADWKIGDKIIISSSSFRMTETEERTISRLSNSNKTVHFTQALSHRHYGVTHNYSTPNGTVVLDERSTVANLSRNIKIMPYQGNFPATELGAHMMIMGNGKAYIDFVEFIAMGRKGEMARYPFHWHLIGNAQGQYIKNSVQRDSFQRCIVIHETNNTLVENNICYNHFGHGIFMETGNEVKNKILKNYVLLSKKVAANKALLESDNRGTDRRFPAPASYWISNPDNLVEDNIAAGSQGSGFWMAFSDKSFCTSIVSCTNPVTTNTLGFNRNIAHSSKVGITWDGAPTTISNNNHLNPTDFKIGNAHYKPTTKAVFKDLVAYKNVEAGIYFRGDAAVFENAIVADNTWSLFLAFSQQIKDSTVIGMSPNFTNNDKNDFGRIRKPYGIVLYDGPFELDKVNFLDFPTTQQVYQGRDITTYPFGLNGGFNRYENKTKGLHFSPEPLKRMDLRGDPRTMFWDDTGYSTSLRDLDGSLTGTANRLVVPKDPFNYTNACTEKAEWNAYICNYKVGHFAFTSGSNRMRFTFKVTNPLGKITNTPGSISDLRAHLDPALRNKFNAVINQNYIYTLTPNTNFAPNNMNTIIYRAEGNGTPSSVLKIEKIHSVPNMNTCVLTGATKLGSLAQVKQATSAAYYTTATSIHLKLFTKTIHPQHAKSDMSNSYEAYHPMKCQF